MNFHQHGIRLNEQRQAASARIITAQRQLGIALFDSSPEVESWRAELADAERDLREVDLVIAMLPQLQQRAADAAEEARGASRAVVDRKALEAQHRTLRESFVSDMARARTGPEKEQVCVRLLVSANASLNGVNQRDAELLIKRHSGIDWDRVKLLASKQKSGA